MKAKEDKMNGKDPEIRALREQLSIIEDTLGRIETILRGDSAKSNPSGLIYEVNENKKLRERVYKIIWMLFATNSGIIFYLIVKALEV